MADISELDTSEAGLQRGWMKKKSPALFRRWQLRFFVLYNKKLFYYTDTSCSKLRGVINFDQVTVHIYVQPVNSPYQIILTLLGHPRRFYLEPEAGSFTEWATALLQHYQVSRGAREELLRPLADKCFWRHYSLSDPEFQQLACTGDLLLFQTRRSSAWLQRFFTRSQFDHVALVLRGVSNVISVLDATGSRGVAIARYADFFEQGWITDYSRVVFRHLEIQRTPEFMSMLREFVVAVNGKRFNWSPFKSLRRPTEPGTENSFFCSELVASAYKRLGLLPAEVSASAFLPGHFAAASSLQLLEGTLAPEMTIDYTL